MEIDKKFEGQSKLLFTFYSYKDYPNINGNSCCLSFPLIILNLSLIFNMFFFKSSPLLVIGIDGVVAYTYLYKSQNIHIVLLQFYTPEYSSLVVL